MSEAKRLGRKGRGDVRITTDSGDVVYLSAYEVRLAYRALYSDRPKRRPAEHEEPSEIARSMSGKVPA